MAMHSATLLAAENRKLRAANEKIHKKRQKKKSYVGKGGVLSIICYDYAHCGFLARRG